MSNELNIWKMPRKLIYILILIGFFNQNLNSQPGMKGRIVIDTAIWAPVAYLSLIPDFDNMYMMSNELIIDKAKIDGSGNFTFNTQYLPNEDVLLRFHVSKRGDLPASLIIGGKDENHFFIIANRKTGITIIDTSGSEFLKDIIVQGYLPNQTLREVDRVVNYLDTTSFDGPIIKTEFIRSAIFEKLRAIADTCSNPLASLYSLYKSKFENNYSVNQQFYKNFLSKWRHQKDPYFLEFRKKLPSSMARGIWFSLMIGVLLLTIGFLTGIGYLKLFKRKSNLLQDLSVQERKIFALLLDGKSNKEISEILLIGLSTVKSHVNNIYSKLGINSRKDLLNLKIDKNALLLRQW